MTAPKAMDVVSLDALLFVGLFFILTMPSAYRMTGKLVGDGWPQILVHGLLFYYLYVLFEPAIPAKFAGIKRNNTTDHTRLAQANFDR